MVNRPGVTQRPRDWAVTLAASAGRVGFGLLFAPFVVAALSGETAARVFQLLFLQGGLITLLSASAYARGAQLAGDGAVSSAARKFVKFLALGTGVSILGGLALLPIPEESTPVRLGVLVVLVTGAASAALTGFLQGVAVVRNGGLAAFFPSVIVSMLGVVGLLALWRSQSTLVVIAAWGLPQVLNLVALLSAVPSARRVFRRFGGAGHDERSLFAATGMVNAASVGVGYAFRERWASGHSGSQAEMGFLVVRVTELVYQVLYMGAASVPRRVNRIVASRLVTRRGRARLVVTGMAAAILTVVPAIVWREWGAERFVIAELAAAPARVLTILCWLFLLGRRTTCTYQAAVVGGMLLAFGGIAFAPIQTSPYGLQTFHMANLVSAVLVVVVAGKRDSQRHRDKSIRST